MSSEYEGNRAFEAEVRRVAEAVWGLSPGDCQPEHYAGNPIIHELDGIARLRDVTHLVMATVSRKLEKIKEDVKKLNAAERIESKSGAPVSKWIVTRDQLEAEHQRVARDSNVKILTLENFRNRFFDGRTYIQKRRLASFGSARNLADGTISIAEDEYVPLPIAEIPPEPGRLSGPSRGPSIDSQTIANTLASGRIVVLIAPFGAGKSLTTREVFLNLAKDYLGGRKPVVPIAVNLREHWGALYGDEMLERHARSIGFTPREDLLVAWRSGIGCLLLDGFDEMASQVVAGADAKGFMRKAREQALQAVRDLVTKMPSGAGLLVCGRDHYFDDLRELAHTLGLTGRQFVVLRLGEFTEDQAMRFLRKHGVPSVLPDWLPRKPLLLGYLAHRGLLAETLKIDGSQGFGHAWDKFLTLICQREATHERIVMDPHTLRRLLERLACDVRATASGTGPITERELAEAYRLETGQVPGAGVVMQLQRLPGLTPREQDPGARSFIDEDMLAALQGSALARFILEGTAGDGGHRWLAGLSGKAISMAAYMVGTSGADSATIVGTALRADRAQTPGGRQSQIVADALAIALEVAREEGVLDCRGITLDGVVLGTLDLEDMRIDNLTIRECAIDEVILGARGVESAIEIRQCMIVRVNGVAAETGLPSKILDGCAVETFDDLSTNAAVIRSDLTPPVKALVTVLRKLYVQAGGGRKLAALKRGMPTGPVLDAVDEIVQILASEGVVSVYGGIAHPVRRQTARVRSILESTHLSSVVSNK